MSAALVKRGLELLNADLQGPDGKKKKKQELKVKKSKKKTSTAPLAGHSRASVKGRRISSVFEEASRGQKTDHTAENLQYFLHSYSSPSSDHTTKIVRQNSGRLSRSSVAPSVNKPREPQSAFTEEEFQQFQMEYFGRNVEDQ